MDEVGRAWPSYTCAAVGARHRGPVTCKPRLGPREEPRPRARDLGGGETKGATKPKVTQVVPIEGGTVAEAKPSPFDPQAAAVAAQDVSRSVAEAKGMMHGGWKESRGSDEMIGQKVHIIEPRPSQ